MADFALPPKLTLVEARAVHAQLEAAAKAGAAGAWSVQAAGLAQFDTSALAVLLAARRLGAQAVLGAPAKLKALAELYGVAELLALQEPT